MNKIIIKNLKELIELNLSDDYFLICDLNNNYSIIRCNEIQKYNWTKKIPVSNLKNILVK